MTPSNALVELQVVINGGESTNKLPDFLQTPNCGYIALSYLVTGFLDPITVYPTPTNNGYILLSSTDTSIDLKV